MPPTPLLVTKVQFSDNCEWGKVHPKMFPPGFKGCDTLSDGWCLLRDLRDESVPIVYFKKADGDDLRVSPRL